MSNPISFGNYYSPSSESYTFPISEDEKKDLNYTIYGEDTNEFSEESSTIMGGSYIDDYEDSTNIYNHDYISYEDKVDNSCSSGYSITAETPPDPFVCIDTRNRLKWVEDSATSKCHNCRQTFSMFFRRHHCRLDGLVYCYTCSNNWNRIPECISQIPTHNGIITNIDRDKLYRLCDECNAKIVHIKKLEVMLRVFQLVELDIADFKNIAKVCKLWRQLANFYLSKFREIQYKLPYQKYTEWEKNALWTNRKYLSGHDIWSVHLFRANADNTDRLPEILDLCSQLNDIGIKSRSACWNRMCTRSCQPHLTEETAIMILDCLERIDIQDKATNKIIYSLIANSFERCDDEILESLLPYIMDKIFRMTNNYVLIDFLFRRCTENIRIANCVYWEIQVFSNDFPDKADSLLQTLSNYLPQDFEENINKASEFVSVVENNYKASKPIKLSRALDQIRNTVSPVNPELGIQNIRSGSISIKSSATQPALIPLERKVVVNNEEQEDYSQSLYENYNSFMVHSSLLYKKEDVRKDLVIMSIIRLMRRILQRRLGIDMSIITYNVLPTTEKSGLIGIVDNCTTLYHITEEKRISILNHIINQNPHESVKSIRQRFIRSCAAYTVITFLLSVNDRHLDNILLTDRGELFHIDYGFILGQDPKPVKTPSMRITSGMLEALGGYHSENYEEFKVLCEQIYDILRKHVNTFVCLLSLLPKHTGEKTWSSPHITEEKMIKEIVKRFAPGENYEAAKALLRTRIDKSTNTSSLSKYHVIDFFHRHNKEGTIRNVFSYTLNSTMSGTKSVLGGIWSYISSFNG